MNRLSKARSAYLRQHDQNPIHWFEWGEEAFAEAERRDLPIFLSVGYSSCHWCHVMAHESFEDPEIAEILNAQFINIKLDREERPDIDELYMTAVQVATGHGGWPMSVFLTPQRKPFFAGTYFPKEARGNFPNFRTVISGLSHSWTNHRDEVESRAQEFAEALREMRTKAPAEAVGVFHARFLDEAVRGFHSEYDYENGGFGGSPKFPPHASIRFLIRYAMLRETLGGVDEDVQALIGDASHMALFALEKMAMGGIHDHVGGGFHRYSTDAEWHLPHFEKMAYDNGQMLYNYSLAAEVAEDERLRNLFTYARDGIVRWVEEEMTGPNGAFFTAIDADSEGEEGAYYVWSAKELESVLGQDYEEFARQFGIQMDGNFLDESTREPTGLNVLSMTQFDGSAPRQILRRLKDARSSRPAPMIDRKSVCSYNAMLASGLAKAGESDLAIRSLETWIRSDDLPHVLYDDEAFGAAFLDDFALLLDALIDADRSDDDRRFEKVVESFLQEMLDRYASDSGGFFYSAETDLEGFGLSRPAFDGATPSPNGVAIRALIGAGRIEDAKRHFLANSGWLERMPTACPTLLECLLDLLVRGEALGSVGAAAASAGLELLLDSSEMRIGSDGFADGTLKVRVPDGFHINGIEPAASWLVPTSVVVEGAYGEASMPQEESLSGSFEIPIRLRPRGNQREFVIRFSYQMCNDDACLAPQEIALEGVLVPDAG